MRRLPIIEVRDGLVICGGQHPTAPVKTENGPPRSLGVHSLLRPVVHLTELEHDPKRPPKVGDHVEHHDDGRRVHVPRS